MDEIGSLRGRLEDLQHAFDALSEDYSGFKETSIRFQKRVGMRWARSPGPVDPELVAAVRSQLGGNSGGNRDFGDF